LAKGFRQVAKPVIVALIVVGCIVILLKWADVDVPILQGVADAYVKIEGASDYGASTALDVVIVLLIALYCLGTLGIAMVSRMAGEWIRFIADLFTGRRSGRLPAPDAGPPPTSWFLSILMAFTISVAADHIFG
jgi:hypothetical protein